MNRRCAPLAGVLIAAVLTGCATPSSQSQRFTTITPFSATQAGEKVPRGWQPWSLSRFKRATEYQLVDDEGVTVVRAVAEQAASGLIRELDVDTRVTPWLSWRWRVPQLIAAADNTRRDAEDAPVRIVVAFDGDVGKLDFEEQAIARRVKALSGREMPYATIMYIWENRQPVGHVIESKHTTRVNMLVVESGPTRRGEWLYFSRNVAEDFQRIYGEPPGRIRSIGILTDTDNTGESTHAYYGDIKFSASTSTK